MFARMRSIWRSLRHRARFEGELDEEMRSHIEARADDLVRSGLSREEAMRRARIEFGCVEGYQDRVRESRHISWFEDFAQDLRFGARMLRKSPGFTAVAVLTLALGIGANTAIFSMVDSLVLRPMPVRAPTEIISLASRDQAGATSNGFSYPDFDDIRSQTHTVFSDMSGIQMFQMDGLSIDGHNEPIWTNFVTPNFFQVLGIRPALGNFFQASDGNMKSSEPVLVLGYAFWKSHLGGDPNVVGKSVSINGHPVTIIGVAPKGFSGVFPIVDTQGYLPLAIASVTGDSPKNFLMDRKLDSLVIIGRLKQGATVGQSQPVLAVIGRRLSEQYAEIHKWNSLQAFSVGPMGPVADWDNPVPAMAAFFLVLVVLVLLLACMNVANLLLVRAASRAREMAVRTALGAGGSRLIRQLLTESVLLALLGCAGGILLGLGATRSIDSINFATAIPLVFNFSFDWRVFTYAFCAAMLTGIVVGIVPAIRAAGGNLNTLLHENPRSATTRRQRVRRVLVVAELGGSLMLLIVAGLFVRSLRAVEHSDLGFDPEHVVNMSVSPTEAGYDEAGAREFLQALVRRAQSSPGVESASLAETIPMGYYARGTDDLRIDGYETPTGQARPHAGYNAVSPGYFETMRIALVRGRGILDSDLSTTQYVAVINQEMAKRYWPSLDPIGRHFTLPSDLSHPIEVVGIVKNSRTQHLAGTFDPYFFRPLTQDHHLPVTLQLRTSLPAATAFHQGSDLIHALAPTMPVFDMQTMTQALDTLNGLLLYQVGAALTASLGTLGLLLALVGVYGVVSYAASQRTHEIGIRMALGARRWQILKMIFGQGLGLTAAGVLIGAALAGAVGRLARDFLSGVSPMDPLTYVCASGLLAIVAVTACYIPARRAMRVDPMVALRHE